MLFAQRMLVSALVIGGLDFLFLGFIAKRFYLREAGHLARLKEGGFDPLLWPAALVYFCLALGITVFVQPQSKSTREALVLGAVFGFVVYGTYDMTNLSLLKDWPVFLSFVDLAWGLFICAAAATVTKLVCR